MKCGACGLIGHMRTNKDCPSYKKEDNEKPAPINVAMTQEQEEEEEKQLGDDELVKTEGTKILLDRRVIAQWVQNISYFLGNVIRSPYL